MASISVLASFGLECIYSYQTLCHVSSFNEKIAQGLSCLTCIFVLFLDITPSCRGVLQEVQLCVGHYVGPCTGICILLSVSLQAMYAWLGQCYSVVQATAFSVGT